MKGLHLKYFVLNPTSSDHRYAAASRKAMLAFAKAIADYDHNLASDLVQWAKDSDPGTQHADG